MNTQTLSLADVSTDPALQTRVKGLDQDHVAELRDAYKANKPVPPGRVFRVGGKYLLTRGNHRVAGAKAAGLTELPFEVAEGTYEDAKLDAAASNAGHGLKRSNADKRQSVLVVIAVRSEWPNAKIADHCGVDSVFVDNVRAEVSAVAAAKAGKVSDRQKLSGSAGSKRKGGPRVTKADHAAEAAVRLKADPSRADADIAGELGCKPAVVGRARKALVREGLIPDPKPAAKAGPKADSAHGGGDEPRDEAVESPAAVEVIPPAALDGWGIPVQPHAAEAFGTVPKFKELLAAVQQAQRLFNEVANLPGGIFLTLPDVSSYRRGRKQEDGTYADRFVHEGLERAYQQVKAAVPTHTVCPYQYADKPHADDCRCCRGKNWTPPLSDSVPTVCIERAKAAFNVTEGE